MTATIVWKIADGQINIPNGKTNVVSVDKMYYGDVKEVLPGMAAQGITVDSVITSPPYW